MDWSKLLAVNPNNDSYLTPNKDLVEVVRCKDCKYWDKTDIDDFGICKYWSGQTLVMQPTPTYHYCACGKSKDDKGE